MVSKKGYDKTSPYEKDFEKDKKRSYLINEES